MFLGNRLIDRELSELINSQIETDDNYLQLKNNMPSIVPESLEIYQTDIDNANYEQVNNEILQYGIGLSEGQILLHGGKLPDTSFITERPLSTTIDPSVALNEEFSCSKAYRRRCIELNILTILSSRISAFLFVDEESDFNHEREILLQSGIKLLKTREEIILNEYPLSDAYNKVINVPVKLNFYNIDIEN